ncbi:MAG TPA: Na(+)-translocating NADH-quinone reductase subunit F [Xanthomarina gelatinilytica]|uniref:Na(+)-translocating NADH-quinone reductase subunit F n=1 Tax=Xanthomarina gelatinilytica TaxID=1137281 RepID=A0A3D6BR62_9FLAO|nr:Na(+)-translocating NADH-quinone reductase subunit F [Xanthomarina gelatinilytica]
MKTTKRLDLAIQKLYTAFHNNTLNPECCQQCAVGNILDHTDTWKHLSDNHGSTTLNYVGMVNQNFGKTFNGYSPLELLHIEAQFLKACGYQLPLHHNNKKPKNPTDKEVLFLGLSAVVQFLCKLDNMPDVMDCNQLFQFQPQIKTSKALMLS